MCTLCASMKCIPVDCEGSTGSCTMPATPKSSGHPWLCAPGVGTGLRPQRSHRCPMRWWYPDAEQCSLCQRSPRNSACVELYCWKTECGCSLTAKPIPLQLPRSSSCLPSHVLMPRPRCARRQRVCTSLLAHHRFAKRTRAAAVLITRRSASDCDALPTLQRSRPLLSKVAFSRK